MLASRLSASLLTTASASSLGYSDSWANVPFPGTGMCFGPTLTPGTPLHPRVPTWIKHGNHAGKQNAICYINIQVLCESGWSDGSLWSLAFLFWQSMCVTGWDDFSSLASSRPTGYGPKLLGGAEKEPRPAPWWQEGAFRHRTGGGSNVLKVRPPLNVFTLGLCYSPFNTTCYNEGPSEAQKTEKWVYFSLNSNF